MNGIQSDFDELIRLACEPPYFPEGYLEELIRRLRNDSKGRPCVKLICTNPEENSWLWEKFKIGYIHECGGSNNEEGF